MMIEHDDTASGRMRAAAALIEGIVQAGISPSPWTYFEDQRRDGSTVGVLDADGHRLATTYGLGTDDRPTGAPEFDAAYIAVLSSLGEALPHLLREMADHYDTDPADGTCNEAAVAVADALMAGFVKVEPQIADLRGAVIPEPTIQPCPECRGGKHVNCSKWSLDEVTDEVVACPCNENGHLP